MASLSATSVVLARQSVAMCELTDGAALLDLETSSYFTLNDTALFLWNALQKPMSVGDLCSALQEEYDVSNEDCFRDVVDVLMKLKERHLVDVT